MTGIDVRRHNGTIDREPIKEDSLLAAVYVKHSGMILALQNGRYLYLLQEYRS